MTGPATDTAGSPDGPHPGDGPGEPEPGARRHREPPLQARNRLNLIEQITADAVTSDYGPRAQPAGPAPRRQRVLVAAIGLGLAGFLLAIGISARILYAPVVAEQRQALRDRIESADAIQEDLVGEVAALRAEVETARAAELERIAGGEVLAEAIADFELATGYSAVTGPGVVVTLEDAPVTEGEERDELEQVLDSDVQLAVNGLWSAGAEAVAVNGSRLTARSAIRSAAGAILVNYRPLQPPYLVEAIGPESLLADFLASQDAATLRGVSDQFGIRFSAAGVGEMLLRAATSALPDTAEVVQPEEGESP